MTGPVIGSLCTGYGGLDMAVRAVLGGQVAWVADNAPGPSKLIGHRWPGLRNLGDITATDWAEVPPVDVLTGGFPCEDVSTAGAKRGLRAGTNSGVWAAFRPAIAVLRPALVIIENVRGLLSSYADSHVEQCPACLGDLRADRVVRACGSVLGDLADLGYDAQWVLVSAAEAGAPHRRERVFIIAWPHADSGGDGLQGHEWGGRWWAGVDEPRLAGGGRPGGGTEPADPDGARRDREVDSGVQHQREPGDDRAGGDGPGEVAADPDPGGCAERHRGEPGRVAAVGGLPADRVADGGAEGPGPEVAADPERGGFVGGGRGDLPGGGRAAVAPERPGWATAEHDGVAGEGPAVAWGPYEPAIRSWELILGRPVPHPTVLSTRGRPVLNPVFSEWVMGLPEGWVTGVPGLSRRVQLEMIGKGVVPQQAALALRVLLS